MSTKRRPWSPEVRARNADHGERVRAGIYAKQTPEQRSDAIRRGWVTRRARKAEAEREATGGGQ